MIKLKSGLERYREGSYDPDFPHVYLVLHGKNLGVSSDVATLKIEKLKKKFSKGYNF